jgi:hypothetical protein
LEEEYTRFHGELPLEYQSKKKEIIDTYKHLNEPERGLEINKELIPKIYTAMRRSTSSPG